MRLEDELCELLAGYLNGAASLSALRSWLLENAERISESGNDDLIRLSDHARIILYELGYGLRDEDDVRTALREVFDIEAVVPIGEQGNTRTSTSQSSR